MSQQDVIGDIVEGRDVNGVEAVSNAAREEAAGEQEDETQAKMISSDMVIRQAQGLQADVVDHEVVDPVRAPSQAQQSEIDGAESLSAMTKKSASNIQGTRRVSSTFDQHLEEQSRSSVPNHSKGDNVIMKQTSKKSSSQQLTNLISTKQIANKNFIPKRSSVTNNCTIQTALRHQTSLNEDLQDLEESKKLRKIPARKPSHANSYRQKRSMDGRGQSKETMEEISPSFGPGKLPRGDLASRSASKHKQSSVTANDESPYKGPTQNMIEDQIHQSGQFELKTNEAEVHDAKQANTEYRQRENPSPETGFMIHNASPAQESARGQDKNPPTTSTRIRNDVSSKDNITTQNYVINKNQSSVTDHSSPRQMKQRTEISNNPLMVGSLKSELNATLLPGPPIPPATNLPQVQPTISITNRQEFIGLEGSYDGTLEDSAQRMRNSSSSNVEQGSSHDRIQAYMNNKVGLLPMPPQRLGVGEGLQIYSPKYLDQQKFMFQIMSQQQPYRIGKQSVRNSTNPNQIIDMKPKQQYQKLGHMTTRSGGSVSPRSSLANDSASFVSTTDKNRKELGTAIQSIKDQGLTQNIGLAQRQAKDIHRHNKLLKQAALQQQKWMYDFQDQNPFVIGAIPKPTHYSIRRELFSNAPLKCQKIKLNKEQAAQSPSQHTYNLDLFKVQEMQPLAGRFGATINAVDRNANDITLLKTNNSNATMKRNSQPVDRKHQEPGSSPFDTTRDLEPGDHFPMDPQTTSRMGLNEDQTNQALPAIGELAADDSKDLNHRQSTRLRQEDDKASKSHRQDPNGKGKDEVNHISTAPRGPRGKSRDNGRAERVPVASVIAANGQSQNIQMHQTIAQVVNVAKAGQSAKQYAMESIQVKSQKMQQFEKIEAQLIVHKRESQPAIGDHEKQKAKEDQMTFQASEGSMPLDPRALNQTSTQLTKAKVDSLEGPTAFNPEQSLIVNPERHSALSKVSRFEQGTGMDTMMINGRNVMIGQSRFHQRDIAGSTFSHSNQASSFREYSILTNKVDMNQTKLPLPQNIEASIKQVIPKDLKDKVGRGFITAGADKPKPAFGSVTSELKPNFNHKSTQRRNTIKKQSELIRLNQKKAGVIKSIGDVVKQAKIQQKQEERREKLKEYLAQTHSYWQDTMNEESVLLGVSIDTSQQDQEEKQYQESLKAPLQIHYNEQMLSNYKFFGARKFPEIDKIFISETNQDQLAQTHQSLLNSSVSDEASAMPSISIQDGKGSMSQRGNSIGFASYNIGTQFQHPKTKQTQRGRGNNLLFSTLRQTLKTESQPTRESINRDIHTAFMNSQFEGIAPSTAKNFNNIRRKKIELAMMNKSSNNWSSLNTPANRTFRTAGGAGFGFDGANAGTKSPTSPTGNLISINQQQESRDQASSSPLDDYAPALATKASNDSPTEPTKGNNLDQSKETSQDLDDQHSTAMKLPRVANASTQSADRQNQEGTSPGASSAQEELSSLPMKMRSIPKQPLFSTNFQSLGSAQRMMKKDNIRTSKENVKEQTSATIMNLQYGKQPTLNIQQNHLRDSPICQSYGQSSPFGKTLNMNTPESANHSPSPPPIIEASESGKEQQSKVQIQTTKRTTPSESEKKNGPVSFIARNKQTNQLRYNRAKTMRQGQQKANIVASSSPYYLPNPQKQHYAEQMDIYQAHQQMLASKQNCVFGHRTLLQTNPGFLKTQQKFQKKYRRQQQEIQDIRDEERMYELERMRRQAFHGSGLSRNVETKDASVGCYQPQPNHHGVSTKENEDTESTGQIIIINTKKPNALQFRSGDTPLPLIPNSLTPTGSNDTKMPGHGTFERIRIPKVSTMQHGQAIHNSEAQTMLQAQSQGTSRNDDGKTTAQEVHNAGSHSKNQSSFRTSDPRYTLDLTKRQNNEQRKMHTKTVYNVISPKSKRDGSYIPNIATLTNSAAYPDSREMINSTPQERKSQEGNMTATTQQDKRPKSYVKPSLLNSLKSSNKNIEETNEQPGPAVHV